MKITLNTAQQALGKLRKRQLPNGQQQVPDLLKAKGEAGIKIYQLKCDIENAFESEIERFRDLLQERQEADQERIEEINEDLTELLQVEKELELSRGKIKSDNITDVIDADILEDLSFAIDL